MKTLYFECNSGISGDMTVAALLDLGADEQALRRGLESLPVDGYSIEIGRRSKSGIDACDFNVILHHEHGYHDQEHHGHTHADHTHEHDHDNHHHTHAEHEHSHGQEHEHRNLHDIEAIIDAASISENARHMAKKIFRVVAEAEAKVHGKQVGQVHFHEVGAVDSIVDIIGAAICIDSLGVERVIASPLREGTGYVRCQHGLMPVPAPATLEIARKHGVPLVITDNKGEMVTPTGAAIVAALAQEYKAPQDVTVLGIGYGAGKKEFKMANVLRAILLEEGRAGRDTVLLLECNLDDMSGEELAYACEKLMEAGALDVWCTAILMKKGRPGQLLSVLCDPAMEMVLTELMFLHTSTLGVRVGEHRRHVMDRSVREVMTHYGKVEVKEARRGDLQKRKVEFESAKRLAEQNHLTIAQVSRSALSEE